VAYFLVFFKVPHGTADSLGEPHVYLRENIFCRVMNAGRQHGQVRHEKVAQARRLIADPDYPPREVLAKVAEKLVSKVRVYRRGPKNRNN
jgi:hypothetical protein